MSIQLYRKLCIKKLYDVIKNESEQCSSESDEDVTYITKSGGSTSVTYLTYNDMLEEDVESDVDST
jgi:hypothetical protein